MSNKSEYVTRFLSPVTQRAYAESERDETDNPVFSDDPKIKHHVHQALKHVHDHVFKDDENGDYKKAKRRHQAFVDLSEPDDDSKKNG